MESALKVQVENFSSALGLPLTKNGALRHQSGESFDSSLFQLFERSPVMKHGKSIFVLSLLAGGLLLPVATSLACGIEGRATRTDGSKVDGTARVSTMWNGNTAYPRDGYYHLELGSSACGETTEVFVNGNSIGKRSIPRDGNARVDFTLKGGSDMPVR
jgi:hypothetical protein